MKSSFIFSKIFLPSFINLDLSNFINSLLFTFALNLYSLILKEVILIGFIDIDLIYFSKATGCKIERLFCFSFKF